MAEGGVGILGRCRIEEYEGGVVGPLELVGRPGLRGEEPRRLGFDACSLKLGEACREAERRSCMRLSRNKPSNLILRS